MQKVKLNLIPQGVPPVVYASQYDVGRQFEFEIYEGDVEYEIPSGSTVVVQGTKPDTHSFAYSSADKNPVVYFSGSVVKCKTTEQMTTLPRKTICEIVFRNSEEEILASLNFFLDVERGSLPEDSILSASELNIYQEMIDTAVDSKKESAKSEKNAKASEEAAAATEKRIHDFAGDVDISDIGNGSMTGGLRDVNDRTKLHIEEYTILATGWTGDTPPFKYDFGEAYKGKVCTICLNADKAKSAEKDVADGARIEGSGGTVIYAYGDNKPQADLHCYLIWRYE